MIFKTFANGCRNLMEYIIEHMETTIKVITLLIAGVDIWLAYDLDQQEKMAGGWPYDLPLTVSVPLVLMGALAFIWYSDYFSERDQESGRWCPSFLVKLVGWCALFAPIVMFLLCKRYGDF